MATLALSSADCVFADSPTTIGIDLDLLIQFDAKIKQALYDQAAAVETHVYTKETTVGPFFSAATFQYFGMLLLDSHPVCSGVLVSPNVFLTAAHCFCEKSDGEKYYSAAECLSAQSPASHGTAVFFPTQGEVAADGPPTIHPSYRFLKVNQEQLSRHNYAAGPTADIALVRLKTAVNIPRPNLVAPGAKLSPVHFFFGFGQTEVGGNPETNRYPPDTYNNFPVGAFSATLIKCISAVPDVYCQSYNALWADQNPTAQICLGDSGGAMLAIDPQNKSLTAFAIASGIVENSDCGTGSGNAMFTDLAPYTEWIIQYMNAARVSETIPPPKQCGDGFVTLRGGESKILTVDSKNRAVKLILFRSTNTQVEIGDNPAIKCASLYHLKNAFSCDLPPGNVARLNAKGNGGILSILCATPEQK